MGDKNSAFHCLENVHVGGGGEKKRTCGCTYNLVTFSVSRVQHVSHGRTSGSFYVTGLKFLSFFFFSHPPSSGRTSKQSK